MTGVAARYLHRQMAHEKNIQFKSIQLFKDQVLGIGSYGKVCKAECDGLLCAAKIIHETLFDPTAQQLIAPHREHRLPMRRFEQECEFLSTIRHPNIIQYLGMYQDPDTHLPVLLMELMDDSLTHFLESSPQPIPYHIQVNICHDVTLALSFLHSNGIVHRDLSSNNVLMIGNIRAKVTDFGMARLGDMNPRATQLTFTMCPGTDVYMPPEAVKDKPVYTEKIDCFSFGVIAIQTMTRLFPQPGDRRKEIEIENVGLVEKRISELERRQNHIGRVNPNHPLKAIALSCLKDKDVERPSAEELCRRVASVKRSPKYSESVREGEEQNREIVQREEALRQYAQQIEGLQQIIQTQLVCLDEKDRTIKEKERAMEEKDLAMEETIAAGQLEVRQLRERLREQICQLEDERKGKDNEMLKLTERISGLELQLRIAQAQQSVASGEAEDKTRIKLKWKKGTNTLRKISNYCLGEMAAATDENLVYVMEGVFNNVYMYNTSTLAWYQLPNSEYRSCALAIVNGLLTLIGGEGKGVDITNQLFSLARRGKIVKWMEKFPPMPTQRYGVCALCTNKTLIVAGGQGRHPIGKVATTELLNTATLQWSTAVDLPQPMLGGSLLQVNDDCMYVLGAYDKDVKPIKSVYTCSLNALLQSRIPQSFGMHPARSLSPSLVWRSVTDIPAIGSSYVSFRGRVLAIGGKHSGYTPITAVHMYDPSTNSWEVVSHMTTPRIKCYAAVLPDNQLIVVGGFTGSGYTDSVEIATSHFE
jgi:serine/threonine protein kinase